MSVMISKPKHDANQIVEVEYHNGAYIADVARYHTSFLPGVFKVCARREGSTVFESVTPDTWVPVKTQVLFEPKGEYYDDYIHVVTEDGWSWYVSPIFEILKNATGDMDCAQLRDFLAQKVDLLEVRDEHDRCPMQALLDHMGSAPMYPAEMKQILEEFYAKNGSMVAVSDAGSSDEMEMDDGEDLVAMAC